MSIGAPYTQILCGGRSIKGSLIAMELLEECYYKRLDPVLPNHCCLACVAFRGSVCTQFEVSTGGRGGTRSGVGEDGESALISEPHPTGARPPLPPLCHRVRVG